jgi:hypothetical protein
MSEHSEGSARYYAYFLVTDGSKGALEPDPFYKRAHMTFETLRRELYHESLWTFEDGTLFENDVGLPRNAGEGHIYESPRHFAVVVDRSRLAEYQKLLEQRAAEHCVVVKKDALARVDLGTGQWTKLE